MEAITTDALQCYTTPKELLIAYMEWCGFSTVQNLLDAREECEKSSVDRWHSGATASPTQKTICKVILPEHGIWRRRALDLSKEAHKSSGGKNTGHKEIEEKRRAALAEYAAELERKKLASKSVAIFAYKDELNLTDEEFNEIEKMLEFLLGKKDRDVFRYAIPFITSKYTHVGTKLEYVGSYKSSAKNYAAGTYEYKAAVQETVRFVLDQVLYFIGKDSYIALCSAVHQFNQNKWLQEKYDYSELKEYDLKGKTGRLSNYDNTPEWAEWYKKWTSYLEEHRSPDRLYHDQMREAKPDFSRMHYMLEEKPFAYLTLEGLYKVCKIAAGMDDDSKKLLRAYGDDSNYLLKDCCDSSVYTAAFNKCPKEFSTWGYYKRDVENECYFPYKCDDILNKLVSKEERIRISTTGLFSIFPRRSKYANVYDIYLDITKSGINYIKWYEKMFAPVSDYGCTGNFENISKT